MRRTKIALCVLHLVSCVIVFGIMGGNIVVSFDAIINLGLSRKDVVFALIDVGISCLIGAFVAMLSLYWCAELQELLKNKHL